MRWVALCAIMAVPGVLALGCQVRDGDDFVGTASRGRGPQPRKREVIVPSEVTVNALALLPKKNGKYIYTEHLHKEPLTGRHTQRHHRPVRPSVVRLSDDRPETGTIRQICGRIGKDYRTARRLVALIVARSRKKRYPDLDEPRVRLNPAARASIRRKAHREGKGEILQFRALERILRRISDGAVKMAEVDQNEQAARGELFTRLVSLLRKNAKNTWIAATTRSTTALDTHFKRLTLSCTRCHADFADDPDYGSPDPENRNLIEELPLPTEMDQ